MTSIRTASSLAAALLAVVVHAQPDLESGFRSPPDSARPHTWWHWMNGNVTREGITADLEAMKAIGLGGAQVFNVSESIPEGPVKFMSAEWLALFKHAAAEANRLGIELCMHNCAGWSSSGGPWITPEYAMQTLVTSETAVKGPSRFDSPLPQPEVRHGFYRDIAVLAFPTPANAAARIPDLAPKAGYEARYGMEPAAEVYASGAVTKRDAIVDLSSKLATDGRLTWDVPAGDWTILRLGHTPTGAVNAPSPVSGRGLEVDKLSRGAFDTHWAGIMAPIIQELGPLAGKTLNNLLIDSYEMGHQNWTERFREEFRRRRGYDPLLYLPAMTGRVIGSGETTERFLWDVRRTIADLFADNYYSYFAELCRRNGIQASIEPYDGPFECMLVGRDADIPMGEFWVGGGESISCKLAASVAHTYGRTLVGAEAFTAEPSVGRWLNHPYSLKAVGDLMYTVGINRYIVHRYAHQPWADRPVLPGMTMGQWGTHFERTTTWWDQGRAWVQYLTRCQYMLQQGLFAADVCYFTGESVPNGAPSHPELKAAGFDYDSCNADVLLNRMTVKDGRLVLPHGMSYRVLVLPESRSMTPRVLGRLREFVAKGATVIGPRPERSPSLADMGDGDALVAKLAAEVWGDCDGNAVKEHRFGAGRVIWGRTPAEVLAEIGPDCRIESSSGRAKAAWIHRVAGGADVYFVSNQRPRAAELSCTFRISGRVPELWHADTGEIEPAPVWSDNGTFTTVSMRFDPAGSVFVVFRRAAAAMDHVTAFATPARADSAREPKIEIVRAVYEAVDGAGGADVTEKVRAMVNAGETSIPANNGAFGDPTYMHLKRLRVEYTIEGRAMTGEAPENGVLALIEDAGSTGPAMATLAATEAGPVLTAYESGEYGISTGAGKSVVVKIPSLPAPIEITGPWKLRFQPGRGAPDTISLDSLASWTRHADPGVKFFSGTAEYSGEFDIAPEMLRPGRAVMLDLGVVREIAEVTLNGKDLGVWWKPPFAADVTDALVPGKNSLTVRVTNLWVNRLIGDEQHAGDVEWNGKPLKAWPEWFSSGTVRPVPERITFTTWHHWTREATPLPSGLIGPVVVRIGERVAVEPN